MFLPAALHKDEHSTYGVTIPDLAGCFSFGDTIEEAINNAKEAAYFHIEGMIEDKAFNQLNPSTIESLQNKSEYQNAIWIMVEIDPSKISQQQTRFNVSWPEYLLNRVDEYTAIHHETRSGFLAKAALAAMNQA